MERYSFSKLNAFHTCQYMYKLTYIDKKQGESNAFASYGTEIHSIMERYAKGELNLWNLVETLEWEYEFAIPEEFPPCSFADLPTLYHQQAVNFLSNFRGYDKYKILGAEENFEITIDDWVFNGIIDLIYIDEDGNLVCQDYKSKSRFTSKREQKEYARQLYLYSLYIKEKFGRYPDKLRFMMFRSNTIVDIPFSEKDLAEALEWAKNTVKEIRQTWSYVSDCDEFFGNNLCNHRGYCEYKLEEEKD